MTNTKSQHRKQGSDAATDEQAFTQLFGRRQKAWRKMTLGYWSDAARSGFFTLLIGALLAGLYGYARSLDKIPADFPYLWIGVPVLAAVVAASPIRTYLQDADRVFLLPAEARIGGYFRLALRSALTRQAVLALVALTALWPMYRHVEGTDATGYPWLAVLVVLAKAAAVLAAWHERRLLAPAHRRLAAA
ncbi:ABC transporter permease, partial [Gorillibacterium massiliense]|uniref:ABC transporter permease n=1 Tax=Gorillibacterium massiliense TaxID=1280390 RepID=UPI001EE287C4